MRLNRIDESYEIKGERLGYIPEYFERVVNAIPTAPELEESPLPWDLSTVRTPLWRFSSPHIIIRSSKPVSVRVSKGEMLYLAENENLGIFTTGETRDEAIHAFCDHLVHFYEHYTKLDWDDVRGDARRLKEIYTNLFEVVRESRPL